MGRKLQISLVVARLRGDRRCRARLLVGHAPTRTMIAEGVTIGGVDVGGLEEDAARSQVRTNLVAPLEKTLTVTYGKEDFELTAKELNVRTDIDGMVDEALSGLPGRRPARAHLARGHRRGRRALDRAEAEVLTTRRGRPLRQPHRQRRRPRSGRRQRSLPAAATLQPIPSETGLKVDEDKMRRQVETALLDPAARKMRPRSTRSSPRSRPPRSPRSTRPTSSSTAPTSR